MEIKCEKPFYFLAKLNVTFGLVWLILIPIIMIILYT